VTIDEIKRLFGLDTKTGAESGRPRACRPRLERLEALRLMSAGAISGHAFLDANGNGHFDAGEAPVAGSTIELKNAAGVVVGTTRTNANGLYSFSADQTVSNAPATLVKTVTLPSDLTNYNKTVSLPKFDPTLGTLTSVEVSFTGSITSDVQTENLSITSAATITANASGVVSVSGPGLNLSVPLTVIDGSFDAATYDGTTDFGGTSGHDFGPKTASGTKTASIGDAATLAAFTGTGAGTVDATVSANAEASSSGGGSLATNAVTSAAAAITVTYHYTPNNALAPGQYTVVQMSPPSAAAHPAIAVTLGSQPSVDNNFADAPPTPSSQTQSQSPVTVVSSQWTVANNQPTTLVLTFSGGLDAARASNLSNYHLFMVGRNGKGATNAGALSSAVYNASSHTVTVTTRSPLSALNTYVLTASGLKGASDRPFVVVFNKSNLKVASVTPHAVSHPVARPSGPKPFAHRSGH
jgi:hypothetical protein